MERIAERERDMSVISDIKMILENADAMCITDAKTYTEQKARIRDANNYVCEMDCVRVDAIREFAERLIEELETVVKQKAEEREHSLVNVSECDGMMLGLAVAIGIAKELADMKG